MRPLYLKLKGFKGVRSGSGKDELEIDFSACTGLVAVAGPNGSGKTTVLDNLHPYRIMPYRAGSYSSRAFSYYNDCYGNGASKEFVFELNGRRYRSLLLIDAERKKQEAYLYEEVESGWKALSDGKTDTYDQTVEYLLGSPQLFFTSVFRCQDAPRLSDYTRGEIKDIFVELLGIESLKAKGQKAKERKEGLLKDTEWLRREKERLTAVIDESKKAAVEAERLKTVNMDLEEELGFAEDGIEGKQVELRHIEAQAALYVRSLEERGSVEARIREVAGKIDKMKGILSRAQTVKDASADLKRYQCKAELLKREMSSLETALTGLQEREQAGREAEKKLLLLRKSLDELLLVQKHSEEVLKKDLRIAKETAGLLGDVPCGTEYHKRCPLLKNAVKAQVSIPEMISRLQASGDASGKEEGLRKEIRQLEPQLLTLTEVQVELKDAVRKKQTLSKEIIEAEAQIRNAGELTKILPEVEFAESMYPGLEVELKNLKAELGSFLDGENPLAKGKEKERELGVLKSKRQEYIEKLNDIKKLLGGVEKKLADGEAAIKEIKTLDDRLSFVNAEVSEWALLERAFGNDGVIALEIDDAGPAISSSANDLLASCFGTRFSVKIDTQAVKADGKGTKETFDITVYDSERDESKSLKTMSGGEKVWIEEAVTRAISLYNAQRSGRSYQALFTDEKDGALDFRRKKEFIAMKKRVIELGGYDVEFFISQSPDVQDAADSKILL